MRLKAICIIVPCSWGSWPWTPNSLVSYSKDFGIMGVYQCVYFTFRAQNNRKTSGYDTKAMLASSNTVVLFTTQLSHLSMSLRKQQILILSNTDPCTYLDKRILSDEMWWTYEMVPAVEGKHMRCQEENDWSDWVDSSSSSFLMKTYFSWKNADRF